MATKANSVNPAVVARFPAELVITVVAPANPKRRAAAVRFALYRSGMTVAAYVKAVKARRLPGGAAIAYRDLAWDSKVGHITLAQP
jgi:hypothetical protein